MKSPLGRLEIDSGLTFQDKLYDLIRIEIPTIVVETGVWKGLSAEFILKALDDNGSGHLYSIDPMDPTQQFNGTFGHPELYDDNPITHPRFTLIRSSSYLALPCLFNEIGDFDFFLHDSDHSHECQTFEYESAWVSVCHGGIIASDDTTWGEPPHRAWDQFLERHNIKESIQIGNARYFRKP